MGKEKKLGPKRLETKRKLEEFIKWMEDETRDPWRGKDGKQDPHGHMWKRIKKRAKKSIKDLLKTPR